MEAAVAKLAAPVAATVAKGILGNKLEELYKLIKYRIKGGGEAYRQVKSLVAELDLEAKLDTVGALLSEIHSHSPSIQTALKHLHAIVDKIKTLLESIAEMSDENSKKWFFGWRSMPMVMMEYLKQLKEYTGVLDIRLNLLLLLLAAQPTALTGGEDIHKEATTSPLPSSPTGQLEPLGPRHYLDPLEQSWLMVDNKEGSPIPEGQTQDSPQPIIPEGHAQDSPKPTIPEGHAQDSPKPTIPEGQTQDSSQPIIPEGHAQDSLKSTILESPPNPPSNTRLALIEELMEMGFTDPVMNAKALDFTNNDLVAAVSLLIEKEA